jgi:DNA-binding FrmR family transcriptional regulator
MFGGRALDLHAADRIDRDLGILVGGTFVLAAATGSGRLGMIVLGGVTIRVTMVAVIIVVVAGVRMAGCGAVIVFAARIALGHFRFRALELDTLEMDTLGGYMNPMRQEIKTSCLKRLKRIEGQIRGLAGMVEDDRYCIDVVTQIAAAKAALRRVEEEILRDHVAHCVEHAIVSGDKADQRRKITELMDVIGRADR